MNMDEDYVRYICGIRKIWKMNIVTISSNDTADQYTVYRERSCLTYEL